MQLDRKDIHIKLQAVSESTMGIWDLPELFFFTEENTLAEDCYAYALLFGIGWGGYFIS